MSTRIRPIDSIREFDSSERRALSEHLFGALREMSADGPGVSRESYGPGEQEAIELIAEAARDEGLLTSWDEAANLIVELPDARSDVPAIICGSHLDSVPQGGNFDGAAGVIAGLLALIRLKREGQTTSAPVRLMAIRGEESAWFGLCYLGSYSLFGQMTREDLDRTHRSTGKPLRDYMTAAGADIGRIEAGERLLAPENVAAYLELHIEQGPVMVAREVPVGIVTGLRGNVRYNIVRCVGEAGHSGAVPRWLRHDSVLAAADLLHRIDEHWRVLLERGLDMVVTAGIISTDPEEHAMSRIPGECDFSLEIRSQSIETLEAFDELIKAEVRSIEKERGVRFEFSRRSLTEPAVMDQRWIDHLSSCCEEMDIRYEKLPSGAGHDAAVFANGGVPSAMIFVRNEHGSHNPNEAMDMDDFMKGADVLYQSLLEPPL